MSNSIRQLEFSELHPLIEDLFDQGEQILFTPDGTSMLPLLRGKKDRIVLIRPNRPLRRDDLVLYRRDSNQFVLHRIVAVHADGTFFLRGDGQWRTEKGIRPDQMIGLVIELQRSTENGDFQKICCETDLAYLRYCRYRRLSYPIRFGLHFIKRLPLYFFRRLFCCRNSSSHKKSNDFEKQSPATKGRTTMEQPPSSSLEAQWLIRFLRAAVKEPSRIDSLPENFNWDLFYELARIHRVENIIDVVLKKNSFNIPSEIRTQFEKAFLRQVMIESVRQVEIERLEKIFATKGLFFIPLKGWCLRSYYPSNEMRTMCDVDFLVKPEQFVEMKELFLQAGYHRTESGPIHDVYEKKPVMNVELHHKLLPETSSLKKAFDGIFERTKPANDSGSVRNLDPSDFYLHLILHFLVHYTTRGIGVRSIMDIYLWNEKESARIDRTRVNRLLTEAGLQTFVENIERLSECWFGDREWDDSLSPIADYLFRSGAAGTIQNLELNRLIFVEGTGRFRESVQNNRIGNLLSRIFPAREKMLNQYPVLIRWRILLPFCWLHRLFHYVTRFSFLSVRERLVYSLTDRKSREEQRNLFQQSGFSSEKDSSKKID